MPTITQKNAKHHCRTCLSRLNSDEKSEELESPATEHQSDEEFKDSMAVDITADQILQQLLEKHVGIRIVEDLDGYPHQICVNCFRKIQCFEEFCKCVIENSKKLNDLLIENCVPKVEVDTEVSNDRPSPLMANEGDIYTMLLKDTLMETESVLLDSSAVATFSNVEMQDSDPFDTVAISKCSNDVEENSIIGKYAISKASSPSSSSECEKEVRNVSDEEQSLTTRLRSKNRSNSHEKKKRCRTKKELEESYETESVPTENKIKRRNKGTKNNFKCEQCNHCFAHKITLDAHTRKVHEGSKRPFQCDRCEKAYTFIGGLYTHIKEIHETQERSYSCDFPGCDRIYTSFIAMQKHKRLKHLEIGSQKTYVCEQCGATFNQTGNLKYHRRTKHPTEAEQAEQEKAKERFECTICKKLFHSRYTLKYHTLQLHTNDMKYECTICGRRMAKKFMLVQHMLVHSTDKMPCEHCGKQFIRKFELEAHIRAVHMKLKPFECQYCTECFASRKTLRHHEYIHTGEKPYVCDICGQAYRQQTCLKNHRKSHDKMNADTGLVANINRTLMSSYLSNSNSTPTSVAINQI